MHACASQSHSETWDAAVGDAKNGKAGQGADSPAALPDHERAAALRDGDQPAESREDQRIGGAGVHEADRSEMAGLLAAAHGQPGLPEIQALFAKYDTIM